MNILLVENNRASGRILEQLLNRIHSVFLVKDESEATQELNDNQYDILISDLGLSSGDGLSLIKSLRNNGGKNTSIPAIALTGRDMQADIDASLKSGFNAHLIKPIDFASLVDLINQLTVRIPDGSERKPKAVTVEGSSEDRGPQGPRVEAPE